MSVGASIPQFVHCWRASEPTTARRAFGHPFIGLTHFGGGIPDARCVLYLFALDLIQVRAGGSWARDYAAIQMGEQQWAIPASYGWA